MNLNKEQVEVALECCTHIPRPDCNNCPMGEKRGCTITLLEFALKYYKELIAENERLKTYNNIYANKVEEVAQNYFNLGKVDGAKEIIKAADEIINLVCVMTGIEITAVGGKYLELRNKYMEGNENEN